MAAPRVTIFIPTWNAGEELHHVLTSISEQRTPFEFGVRVVDSGSTDGTHGILKKHGIEYDVIDRSTFHHARTRQKVIEESRSEFVAFLSQDARPADAEWLARLMAPFEDRRVAGAYARQIPRPDCHPFQRINVEAHMAGAETTIIQPAMTPDEFKALLPAARLARIRFDNVSSAMRREAAVEIPIPEVPFGEDLAWARDVLLAGHDVAFCTDAVVLHSHALSREQFTDRVADAHQAMRRETDFVPIPSRAVLIRRILGTWRRFTAAAWADVDAAIPARIGRTVTALPWAIRQMKAMYRGGHAGAYRTIHDET